MINSKERISLFSEVLLLSCGILLIFFIPGIYLPMVPTPEDLEFTQIYGTRFTGVIPDLILILSLGILPLLVFFMNRSSNSIFFLASGATVQIISVLVGNNPYNSLLTAISLTLTAISMAYYAYYGYQIMEFLLILFPLLFFIGRLLFFLMI